LIISRVKYSGLVTELEKYKLLYYEGRYISAANTFNINRINMHEREREEWEKRNATTQKQVDQMINVMKGR